MNTKVSSKTQCFQVAAASSHTLPCAFLLTSELMCYAALMSLWPIDIVRMSSATTANLESTVLDDPDLVISNPEKLSDIMLERRVAMQLIPTTQGSPLRERAANCAFSVLNLECTLDVRIQAKRWTGFSTCTFSFQDTGITRKRKMLLTACMAPS